MKAFLFAALLAQFSHAYIFSKTEQGEKIKWNASENMPFYVNPADENSAGVDAQDVKAAIEDSLDRWNQTSSVKFSPIYTETLPPAGTKATFRFSSNPAYFGSGVLAVTSVSYNNATGTIYGADILMNDSAFASATFTANPALSSGPYAYIGDVMAHEFGHLLGLNHSETQGATMIYSIFKGQHRVSSDDKSGVKDLYDFTSGSSVRGVVAGERHVPVFGAHVQAIDLESNKTMAGVFTESNGEFEIKGLDPQGSYVLYISPIKNKADLPRKYSSFREDFCNGNSFQPSFFSKCGGRSAGRAQVIIPRDKLDLGVITVKCATSIDPKYLQRKAAGFGESHVVWDYFEKYRMSETFTGHFSKDEISQGFSGVGDRLKIDLSGAEVTGPSSVVEIGLSTEKLGTGIGLGVYTKRVDQGSYQFHSFKTDPFTGKSELDFKISLPLSSDSDDNVFELDIYPVSLSQGEKTSIFASPKNFINDRDFYFMSAVVKTDFGAVQDLSDVPYEDNSSCLEGNPGAASEAYEPISENGASELGDTGFSCATVNDLGNHGGGPGAGPMSFVIGCILSLIVLAPRRKRPDFFV